MRHLHDLAIYASKYSREKVHLFHHVMLAVNIDSICDTGKIYGLGSAGTQYKRLGSLTRTRA
jgi:hypothetical protein